MKKVQSAYYKREGSFVDPYHYDIIFNAMKPEFKTKLLNVTRSGSTLAGHLRAIEEHVEEAMQKMMEFYHNKEIDMLKLGCTLPNSASICLHKSTNSRFYPIVEADKDLHDKIREVMTGAPSIVFY